MSAENYQDLFCDVSLPKRELLEIHRSKISLHVAKADYSYPTIRLPHTFSKLAGLPTQIYQTVHEGALAFLVVISSTENADESPKASVFTRRRSPVRIRPSPLVFVFAWAKAFVFGRIVRIICGTFAILTDPGRTLWPFPGEIRWQFEFAILIALS
jgi:hypothetical protein